MCGIAGIGFLTKNRTKEQLDWIKIFMSNLLVESELRGTHATGIAINNEGRWDICKNNVNATNFVLSKEYKETIEKISNKTNVVLGHTRAATKGSPTNNNNNHPIVTEQCKVVGVHNGMIWNDDELFKEYHLPRQAEVDSEIIFRLLEQYDELDLSVVKNVCETLSGSFAFACTETARPHLLWLAKKNNPCVIYYIQELEIFAFASVETFLLNAIDATQKISTWKLKDDYDDIIITSLKYSEIVCIDLLNRDWQQTEFNANHDYDYGYFFGSYGRSYGMMNYDDTEEYMYNVRLTVEERKEAKRFFQSLGKDIWKKLRKQFKTTELIELKDKMTEVLGEEQYNLGYNRGFIEGYDDGYKNALQEQDDIEYLRGVSEGSQTILKGVIAGRINKDNAVSILNAYQKQNWRKKVESS